MTPDDPKLAPAIRPTRILVHLPGLVALAVGITYIVGALTKVSEVEAAGFSASVVLSLTPIQQLLALGVSSVATSGTVIGATVLALEIAAMAWYLDRHDRTSEPRPTVTAEDIAKAARDNPQPPPSRLVRAREEVAYRAKALVYYVIAPLVLLLFAVRFVVGILNSVPTVVLPLIVVGPAIYLLARRLGFRMRDRIGMAFTTALVVSAVAGAYAYPSYLPVATIITRDGTYTGRLVANTENATSIGLPDCRVLTIPAAQIRSVTVGPVHHRRVRTLDGIIFGAHRSTKSKPNHEPCE